MSQMKITVSHDYLLKLAYGELTDNEILRDYFKYYFCQGRNIGDLKHDYMTAGNPMTNKNADCIFFQDLGVVQIKESIKKVETVLNEFLENHFGLRIQESMNL